MPAKGGCCDARGCGSSSDTDGCRCGVIGLCCGLAAADAGWRVTVLTDPGTPRADVAGGMLGSLGEGHPGEDALLEITADSVRRWPTLLAPAR